MASYFFRVEHELLRSDAFKALGGSAIKVYLVIGLFSDFGSDWAYPSIRTIARQAGLSRQTVISAIEELTRAGLLAASRSPGRSTAYKILRSPATGDRPSRARTPSQLTEAQVTAKRGLELSQEPSLSGQKSLDVTLLSGQKNLLDVV